MKILKTKSPALRRIIAVAKKETLHIVRDLRSLGIVLLMPLIMLLLYGYAINFDIKNVHIAIVDHDNSSDSRAFIEKFTSSDNFKLTRPVSPIEKDAIEDLRTGEATLVMVIPERFSTDLKRNRDVTVQVIADGADPNTASIAIGYATSIVAGYSGGVTLEHVRKLGFPIKNVPGIRAEPRVWFNQEMKSSFFIVPGLISIIMMLTSALLTSLTIIREKENGTFEQLSSTPIRPIELMIGKLLPYVAVGFADVIIITFFGGLIFNVPFRGSLLLLGFFSLLFIFCALGIGLFISSMAPNQTVAVIGTVFITVLPSVLLSGFVFSIDTMDWFIKPFTFIVPARYFLSILRTLFLKSGAGFGTFALDGLALLVFGIILLVAASKRLKKNLE